MRSYKDGEYYYAPHGRFWGIWLYHETDNGGGYGTFVKEYRTKEEARREVFKLNKWNDGNIK